MSEIILGIYGVLLAVGAVFGAQAGSRVSLVAGLTSAVCVFFGLWMARSNPQMGFIFLTVITGLLEGMFLFRFMKTKKFMPSGMLMALSGMAFMICVLTLLGIQPFAP